MWKRLVGWLAGGLIGCVNIVCLPHFVCIFLHVASAIKYSGDGRMLIALPEMCAARGQNGMEGWLSDAVSETG